MGDVTAWQNSAGENQTPGPKGLTFLFVHPHRYRTRPLVWHCYTKPAELQNTFLKQHAEAFLFQQGADVCSFLVFSVILYKYEGTQTQLRGQDESLEKVSLSFAGGSIPFLRLHQPLLNNSSNPDGGIYI